MATCSCATAWGLPAAVSPRVALPDAACFLLVPRGRRLGRRPVTIVIGSVPFFEPARHHEAVLVVPALLVGVDAEGTRWVTQVFGGADEPPAVSVALGPARSAQRFAVGPLTPVERYLAAVTRAVPRRARRLAPQGGHRSRKVEVTSDEPIHVHAVLLRLRAVWVEPPVLRS